MSWPFYRFKLIVTGKGEAEHLPKLFTSLTASGICTFDETRFINQRPSLPSSDTRLNNVPTKDEEIGLEARWYLTDRFHKDKLYHFVILIDDLEHDRRDRKEALFQKYRQTLDQMLITEQQRRHTSVHFLVNMLEAYYFADVNAINSALELNPPISQEPDDVETLRHPKRKLQNILRNPPYNLAFREKRDGGEILSCLNIMTVLANSQSCRALRTLFAWCHFVLKHHPQYEQTNLPHFALACHLEDGEHWDVTFKQLENVR